MAERPCIPCRKWIDVTHLVTVCRQELSAGRGAAVSQPDYWQILYSDRGTCRMQVDGRQVSVKQGQFLLTAPGSRIKLTEPVPASLRVIRLGFVCRMPREFVIQGRVFAADDRQKDTLRELLHRGEAALEQGGDTKEGMQLRLGATPQDLQMLQNRLESFLIALWEKQNPRNACQEPVVDDSPGSLAVRIEAFLRENLTGKLTLEQVGTHFGVSVSYVKQVFGAHYGHGIVAHWNRLRIEQAKQLIRSADDMNFSQISERLGFSSVHYFSRLFRAVAGMSPSEYARSLITTE